MTAHHQPHLISCAVRSMGLLNKSAYLITKNLQVGIQYSQRRNPLPPPPPPPSPFPFPSWWYIAMLFFGGGNGERTKSGGGLSSVNYRRRPSLPLGHVVVVLCQGNAAKKMMKWLS
eukprot:scaffold15438_cov85-Skeletonema_dohrnii-CCMP3373.AAC.1